MNDGLWREIPGTRLTTWTFTCARCDGWVIWNAPVLGPHICVACRVEALRDWVDPRSKRK